MKILFLSHYGAMLGANRSLLSMILGLKKKGVQPMVWCPKGGAFTQELRNNNIPIKVFGYQNWADTYLFPGYWMLPLRYLRNKAMLNRLVDEASFFKPDVIHTNSSVLPMGAYIADRLKVPHIWHMREFGELDYNMRFFPGKTDFYAWLSKAEKVIVISEAIKQSIIGDRDIPHELIFNGVAPKTHFAQAPPKTIKPSGKDVITFLLIGMLHPNKNQLVAIQAFEKVAKEYPNARLLIVGSGRRYYEKQLKDFSAKHQLNDQVVFAGYIPNPIEAYEQSDIVLMCSQNEAMGRVTVEAMAYAKPVIGFNSGATPELIEQGEDGFLYENGPEQLASCMRYFLRHPSDIRVMGMKGFKKAKQKFTIDNYVDKMYRIFDAAAKKPKME